MLQLTFLSLFILTPFLIIYLLKIAGEKTNKISIVNITVLSLYIFSIVGTFPLFFMLDEYRISTGVTDEKIVFLTLFCSIINLIFFLLGIIFVRRILGLKPYPFASSQISNLSYRSNFAAICMFAVVVLTLLIYISKLKSIAIFSVFMGDMQDLSLQRSNMGNNFESGNYHWYSMILHKIGFLLTLNFYAAYLIKKTKSNMLFLISSILLSSFIAVMAIEKAPFIELLLALVMIRCCVKSNAIMPMRSILITIFVSLSILVVFYIFFRGSLSISAALSAIFSRAFSGSISPAYFYLNYFPNVHEYLFFKSFPNPGGFLPFTPVRYTVDVMNWVFPEMLNSSVVGTMPTVFWGEAFANFGFIGIPVVGCIMGIIVAFFSYLYSKLELNSMTVSFYIFSVFHYKTLSVTGFSGFLIDFYFLCAFLVLLVVLFSNGKIRLRKG